MTKKAYYEDSWLQSCEAVVLACEAAEDGYKVLLDQTVIFPEGGGQPSDTGSLDDIPVSMAEEDGENIWHGVKKPLPAGARVQVKVDMPRRRDHSQQHTGEHILSGLASKLYGAHNVGFHMAESYSTLDLDMPLSDEQLEALEREANAIVQADTPVTYRFVQAEELESIPLRKQAKGLTGEVRIVYIQDADSCTCCGTHCRSTGEVGCIRLSAWQNYKGGVRLWFACGMRAIAEAAAQRRLVEGMARRFSTGQDELAAAVQKQGDELMAARRLLKVRTDALLAYKAAELLTGADVIGKSSLVLYSEPGLSAADLKTLAEKLTEKSCAAVLFSHNGDTLSYQLASSQDVKLSMREACSAVNAAVGGRGGGKDHFAQGSAKAQGLSAETLEQLRAYLRAALKNA